MRLELSPKVFLLVLLGFSTCLALAGFASLANWHLIGFRNIYTIQFVNLFDLSTDNSVPTWYSSVLLLMASVFLCIVWKNSSTYTWHWLILGLLFLFFSIDEVAMIHERAGDIPFVAEVAKTSHYFHYQWIVAGVAFVLAIGLFFLPFLWSLPARHRWLFTLSAIIFVGGALGVETLNSAYSSTHGSWNMTYAATTAVEEFMEMSGVSIFVYSILDYIKKNIGSICITIIEDRDTTC